MLVLSVSQGDVFFYYGLINFHQNLRRYMNSRDDAQLVGRKNSLKVHTVLLSLFVSVSPYPTAFLILSVKNCALIWKVVLIRPFF